MGLAASPGTEVDQMWAILSAPSQRVCHPAGIQNELRRPGGVVPADDDRYVLRAADHLNVGIDHDSNCRRPAERQAW